MKAWPAPEVPELPGVGVIPRVYDVATGQLRTEPAALDDGDPTARLYVCGITPYDATHIGHAATYVTFDLLVRAWRDAGLTVRYAQNVTDIDDPLLERADETGEDWRELARRQTELFATDMNALRVITPDWFVGAVEAMPVIAELIDGLRSGGYTYEVDGDLYFRSDLAPGFGRVSGLDRATMLELFAERGGDPGREGKKDPLDWLLWRRERSGEPAWDTVLGRGRPGWHVECAAIAVHHLGRRIDVQGGGTDLAFPHHEMSAVEAGVAAGGTAPDSSAAAGAGRDGDGFVDAYVHQAMIGLDGHKMSKSRGNLVFVSGLRGEGADPMAIRLALLAHHYREEWEWTPDGFGTAQGRLDRWRQAVRQPEGPAADAVLARIRAALAADLDAPAALAAVDDWAGAAATGQGNDPAAPDLVRRAVDALLGVAL